MTRLPPTYAPPVLINCQQVRHGTGVPGPGMDRDEK